MKWSEKILPLVRTMDLAASLNQDYLNKSPKTLSTLIKIMAAELDGEDTSKIIEKFKNSAP